MRPVITFQCPELELPPGLLSLHRRPAILHFCCFFYFCHLTFPFLPSALHSAHDMVYEKQREMFTAEIHWRIFSSFSLQPKQSDIMADCGYAEDCYLLKYLLPFTQAYRKAAKNAMFACSGESTTKVIIPELEELPEIGYAEEEDYHYGEITAEGEDDLDEYENEIEDGDEGEDEENNSTRLEHGLTNRYFNFK